MVDIVQAIDVFNAQQNIYFRLGNGTDSEDKIKLITKMLTTLRVISEGLAREKLRLESD